MDLACCCRDDALADQSSKRFCRDFKGENAGAPPSMPKRVRWMPLSNSSMVTTCRTQDALLTPKSVFQLMHHHQEDCHTHRTAAVQSDQAQPAKQDIRTFLQSQSRPTASLAPPVAIIGKVQCLMMRKGIDSEADHIEPQMLRFNNPQ